MNFLLGESYEWSYFESSYTSFHADIDVFSYPYLPRGGNAGSTRQIDIYPFET